MTQILERIRHIYENSFLADERRSFAQLVNTFATCTTVNIKVFDHDNKTVGFIIYWRFTSFVYIEHFAFDSFCRGQGNGTKALREFVKQVDMPVILEVEPAVDNLTSRRIEFYIRLGFCLHSQPYTQPPYDETKNAVDMHLMSYNIDDFDNRFAEIKETIYREVYGRDK
ncbi:MAG: GNAT family N-acetyltransferase [Porphyromonadaceae bacterium]|nr:GNAT family N-acetyltransferase [Porphyromonadaceae bacterium]